MIYFTSDTHFGHTNILKHCKRPFNNIDEMDASITDIINNTVKQNDTLYLLGDFAWRPNCYGFYRERLNVRQIHVVLGNHDKLSIRKYVSTAEPVVYRRFGTVKIFMSHYPHISWCGSNHGSIHLYGHSHGILEEKLNTLYPHRLSMDVGIDVAWKVWSLDEIIERFK